MSWVGFVANALFSFNREKAMVNLRSSLNTLKYKYVQKECEFYFLPRAPYALQKKFLLEIE